MGKVRYVIMDLDNDFDFEITPLLKEKIVSSVTIDDAVIVARHGVNKTTLKKILKKYLKEEEE